MTVIFDDAGHAIVAGNIRVFHYVAETGEYWTWSDEFIPVGVSIPGNSTLIDPGEDIAGHVWVFDGAKWLNEEDHRGDIVYSIETGSESVIETIGSVSDKFTVVPPTTPFDTWSDGGWVTDSDAQNKANTDYNVQKRNLLRLDADTEITWRQYAVDKGIATEGEVAQLDAWKIYCVKLMRVDTSKPEWPQPPEA